MKEYIITSDYNHEKMMTNEKEIERNEVDLP